MYVPEQQIESFQAQPPAGAPSEQPSCPLVRSRGFALGPEFRVGLGWWPPLAEAEHFLAAGKTSPDSFAAEPYSSQVPRETAALYNKTA